MTWGATCRLWTAPEYAELRRRYQTSEPVATIARDLNRSECAIVDRAYRLGLKRPWWVSKARMRVPPPRPPPKIVLTPWPDDMPHFEDDPSANRPAAHASTGWI